MDYSYVCKDFHNSCLDVNKSNNNKNAFLNLKYNP